MKIEPRYSKDKGRPTRGPKNKTRMLAGKKAVGRGLRFQNRLAKALGMRSKRRGIDLVGDGFCLSAKSLEYDYPETVRKLLEEALIMTRKEFPESWGGVVIGRAGAWEKLGEALVIIDFNTFRMLLGE